MTRSKWETRLLAMLMHLHCDDMYKGNNYTKSHEAFVRLPGQENVTMDEFKSMVLRDGQNGIGLDCYVISSSYPGGGFRGAEKVCYMKDKPQIYIDLDEAEMDCNAMNLEYYEATIRNGGTPPSERVYHVFAIRAFACQIQQIDKEDDFD